MKYGTIKRPVALTPLWGRRDVQQDPPAAWCLCCGAEVWTGEGLCEWCRHLEERRR